MTSKGSLLFTSKPPQGRTRLSQCHAVQILASRSSYGGSASVPTTEPFLVPSPCRPPNSARTRSPRDQGRTITRSESPVPASIPPSRCASSPVDWIPFCDGGLVCVSTEGATLTCGGARTIGLSPPLRVGLVAIAGECSGGGGREWGWINAARCWRRRRAHLQKSASPAMNVNARTRGRAISSPLDGCVRVPVDTALRLPVRGSLAVADAGDVADAA